MKTDEQIERRLESLREEREEAPSEIETVLGAQIEMLEWVLDGNGTVSGERVARLKMNHSTPFDTVLLGFRDQGGSMYVQEEIERLGQFDLMLTDEIPQIR